MWSYFIIPYKKLILVTNELLLHETIWMELINIMLKERSQTGNTCYMVTLTYSSQIDKKKLVCGNKGWLPLGAAIRRGTESCGC